MQETISNLLDSHSDASVEIRSDGMWLESAQIDVVSMARQMAVVEAVLSTITAVAREDGETDLIYHYRFGKTALNIKACTRGYEIPSISNDCPSAEWIEREIQDLYAIKFLGHPNPAPLILPPGMAAGYFRQPGGKKSAGRLVEVQSQNQE